MRYWAIFKRGKLVVQDKTILVFPSKGIATDNLSFENEEVVEVTITKKEEI